MEFKAVSFNSFMGRDTMLMLKYCFIFFLIVSGRPAAQSAVDSLEAELAVSSGVKKAALLNDLSEEYLSTDLDKSKHYAERALEESVRLGDKNGQAAALSNLGYNHGYRNEYTKAVDYYKMALDVVDDTVPFEITGDIYNRLGHTYNRIGNSGDALLSMTKAYTLFKNGGNLLKSANSANNLGLIFLQISRYDSSLTYFSEALELRKTRGTERGIALTNNNIGTVHYQLGNYKLALEHFLESLRIRETIDDKRGYALVMSNIGKTYRDWGETDEAMRYFTSSLKIGQTINDDYVIGYSQYNIGIVLEKKGELDSSLVYYHNSLERYRAINDLVGVIRNLNSIANVNNNLGNYDKARDFSNRAYEKAMDIRNDEGRAVALKIVGATFLNQHDPQIALEKFNQSLELSLKIGQRELIKDNYLQIFTTYKALNDTENALKYHMLLTAQKDSLFNDETVRKIERIKIAYDMEKKEKEKEILRIVRENQQAIIKRNKTIFVLISLFLVSIIALAVKLYMLNRQKRKANVILLHKNREISSQRDEIERKINELEQALSNITFLRGLLPICANCKKIRDDKGYWNEVESYITKHSDASFSHGICPECLNLLYPEYVEIKDNKSKQK
ncbi:tetratricopeptide repeat protein [Candidatus Omnitrophota bacterium]